MNAPNTSVMQYNEPFDRPAPALGVVTVLGAFVWVRNLTEYLGDCYTAY